MVNISMLIISTIWFTFDLSVSSVPRPCLYMLGSPSLTRVFRMCKTVLHPLYANVESITPDHHVVSQHDKLSQWCILRENTYTFNLVKGSSYNDTVVLSKIRCIKINITCNQNMWHDMAIIIFCFWSPSPKHRHDLHCHWLDTLITIVASWSSRQLLLLQLSLLHSDKVKQLHGVCISYNKDPTIWLLPVADNFYKTWSSHTITYMTSCLDHITSQSCLAKTN